LGGLAGAVWALTINLVFNWLLNHLALRWEAKRHNVKLILQACWREWPVLWRFSSVPAFLAASMFGPADWICSAMLVNQPDGYGEIGIYNAANQWFTLLLFLPNILGNVVLPMLSDQLGRNETDRSFKTLLLAIAINFSVVTPLVLIAGLASPYIISLYGESFSAGWPTLVVALLTAGLLAVQTPVGHIIAASGRMWLGFAMNIGSAVVFVLGTFLLVKHGSVGLATARLISYFLHSFWVLRLVIWLPGRKDA
jgi:O-antigen/teichoic acid export membrane protein